MPPTIQTSRGGGRDERDKKRKKKENGLEEKRKKRKEKKREKMAAKQKTLSGFVCDLHSQRPDPSVFLFEDSHIDAAPLDHNCLI